jgi:adenylate cyclase
MGLDVDSLLASGWDAGEISLPGMPAGTGRIPQAWLAGDEGADFALPFPLRFLGPPSSTEASEGGSPDRGTFRAYSASYVPVLAQFVPEDFRDRIILLGSGFHQEERFRSPFYDDRPGGEDEGIYGWTYGVEVHANALQGFLDGRYISHPGEMGNRLLLLTAAAIPAAAVFLFGAIFGGLAALLSGTLVVAGALWAFQGAIHLPWGTLAEWEGELLWLPVVAPLVSTLLSYVGSTGYVAVVEGREKRFIRGAFGKYVSPAVVDEIAKHPERLRLGGEKRPLSVLFSDLAGFTSLSESLPPEELISLLNEYLSEMTRVVMEEEGTLDKYIGDAIMAFWNAPKSQTDHTDRALRCALRMQDRLRDLNRKWEEEGRSSQAFRVRIGVNTDRVVVGNVGGEDRFDYSAIGDGVNLAARLEPANDTYGTLVMASEFTVEATTPGAFRFRELDRVAMKGKSEPVRIFEVVALAGEPLPSPRSEALDRYDAGYRAYRARSWSEAVSHFEGALEADPEDGPSHLLLQRCLEFRQSPPPKDWDFAVRRKNK